MTSITPEAAPKGKLNAFLWTAQALIGAAFTVFGGMKLFLPAGQLAGMWVWPGQVPEWFLRMMGVIDVAGGVGVLLPALSGIYPRLTVLAAFGCSVLQVCAIAFHAMRGEFAGLPLNFVLLALCLFILWGRNKKIPL